MNATVQLKKKKERNATQAMIQDVKGAEKYDSSEGDDCDQLPQLPKHTVKKLQKCCPCWRTFVANSAWCFCHEVSDSY